MSKCQKPIDRVDPDTKQKFQFPCRSKCDFCLWRRASSLRGRIHCEQLYKQSIDPKAQGSFITLTYEHEPPKTRMADIKNFKQKFRKLEKSHGNKCPITFIQVSERGLKYGRLHWHIMTMGNYNHYNAEVQKWLWPLGHVTFRQITDETIGYITQYVQNERKLHEQNSWSNGLGKHGLWLLLDQAKKESIIMQNWDASKYNMSHINWYKQRFSLDQSQRKWFSQWLETNGHEPIVPDLRKLEIERQKKLISPYPDMESIKKEIASFKNHHRNLQKQIDQQFRRQNRATL